MRSRPTGATRRTRAGSWAPGRRLPARGRAWQPAGTWDTALRTSASDARALPAAAAAAAAARGPRPALCLRPPSAALLPQPPCPRCCPPPKRFWKAPTRPRRQQRSGRWSGRCCTRLAGGGRRHGKPGTLNYNAKWPPWMHAWSTPLGACMVCARRARCMACTIRAADAHAPSAPRQGRARTFPHVTGSYATHVYTEGERCHATVGRACRVWVQSRHSMRRRTSCGGGGCIHPRSCMGLCKCSLQPLCQPVWTLKALSPAPAVPTPPSCQAALEALLRLLQARLPELRPTVHASSSVSSSATQPPPAAATRGPSAPAAAASGGSAPAAIAQRQYHVSLSRTVALQLHQIGPLVEDLRRRLRWVGRRGHVPLEWCAPMSAAAAYGTPPCQRCLPAAPCQPLKPRPSPCLPGRPCCRRQDTFCIRLGRLAVFCNDDRTRTFLSLAAEEGDGGSSGGGGTAGVAAAAEGPSNSRDGGSSDSEGSGDGGCTQPQRPRYSEQLVGLCHAVSGVFAAHGLPRFYADPQPHASGEQSHREGPQVFAWLRCVCMESLAGVLPGGLLPLECEPHVPGAHHPDPTLCLPCAVAWLLGDCQQQLEAALAAPEVQAAARTLAAQHWRLQPAAIVCKAGQREHAVWPASA